MSESEQTSRYRSPNMALVTYLRMSGHAVQEVVWDKPSKTAHWIFFVSDGVLGAVDIFSSGSALVDPREFNREFAKTKSEFHSASRR